MSKPRYSVWQPNIMFPSVYVLRDGMHLLHLNDLHVASEIKRLLDNAWDEGFNHAHNPNTPSVGATKDVLNAMPASAGRIGRSFQGTVAGDDITKRIEALEAKVDFFRLLVKELRH